MHTHHSRLVLCATSRLAQDLNRKLPLPLQAGQAVAQTQWACTFTQWVDWLFDEMHLRGLCTLTALQATVLSPFQERIVWEQAIAQCLGADALQQFNIGALAQSAMEAHTLQVVWGVASHSDEQDETRAFIQWQQQFIALCTQHQRVDTARWQQAVVQNFVALAHKLHLPHQVSLAGFTRLNPLEDALINTLRQHHCTIDFAPLISSASQIATRSYPDAYGEVLAAALWARDQLHQHPQHRIALVVPDLANQRHLIQDTLEDLLPPHAFNLSLGTSLAESPLVQCALQLLQIIASPHRLEQNTFSQLLRSPFWSDNQNESTLRANMEAQLRKNTAPTAALHTFCQRIAARLSHSSMPFLVHLESMQDLANRFTQRQSASCWAQQLPSVLSTAGWLVGRSLSSHEYQTQAAFYACIQTIGQLDALLGSITLAECVAQLRKLCQEQTFQPETEGDPPLQVLGLLEASGLRFDAMWIMGMQDTTWPPPARPNPLLSAQAQRHANAPNASATIQLNFAQGIHKLLLAAAPDIVFSWARTAGAAERNPSPLIPATASDAHLPAPPSPHWTWQAAASGGTMLDVPIDDATAPPVLETETVKGGTWLLRAQAICPAWGYYQYRLGASKLEDPTEGLDARQKGSFLHAALEAFWNQVQTLHALQALSRAQRSQLISEAVSGVLHAHNTDEKQRPLKPRLQQLEHNRLCRLIEQWLDQEAARAQPFTVLAHEREVHVDIQGIRFTMKVDRIDQLDDGSLLIIDYKTGASIDTRNWATQRLTEPQLPIYAAIHPPPEGPVVGVVFAKVHRHEPGWAGLTEHDKILPKVHGLCSTWGRKTFSEAEYPDWPSVLQHWQQAINAVAREIKRGDAGVRFEDAQALAYCEVLPLLRLAERQAQRTHTPKMTFQ
jgi:exodeoxyribonuclease-5